VTTLAALWLPILVSAVLVFIASSIIHMAPLWHRNDLPGPPDGDRLQDALRPFRLQPGEYMLPRPQSMKDCNTPEFIEKLKRGPVLIMTVIASGPMSMARPLVQWFIFIVVVSVLTAYLAGATLPPDAAYLEVFRVASTTAFLAYAAGVWPQSIWYHRPWGKTLRFTLDGLIYGLLTGGAFGWLWHAV
jgi:hypothetical protein